MSFFQNESNFCCSAIEITTRKTIDRNSGNCGKYKYPRHISQWESQSHRSCGGLFRNTYFPAKSCKLFSEKNNNNTLNILRYQIKDEKAKQAHLENIKSNKDDYKKQKEREIVS